MAFARRSAGSVTLGYAAFSIRRCWFLSSPRWLVGAGYNAYVNMQARGIPLGFGFWNQVAGFDINLHLIPYSPLSTYGRAFWVGLLNTLLVAIVSIPLATLFGFAIGIARLSPNWLLSRCALAYTNLIRNTPLLLQLLFWYNAVLRSLPGPRQSIGFGHAIYLNNRGVFLPMPIATPGGSLVCDSVGLSVVAASDIPRLGARTPSPHRSAGPGPGRQRIARRRTASDRRPHGRRPIHVRNRQAVGFQFERRPADYS